LGTFTNALPTFIKKPAKKLLRVLYGLFYCPKKDSLATRYDFLIYHSLRNSKRNRRPLRKRCVAPDETDNPWFEPLRKQESLTPLTSSCPPSPASL